MKVILLVFLLATAVFAVSGSWEVISPAPLCTKQCEPQLLKMVRCVSSPGVEIDSSNCDGQSLPEDEFKSCDLSDNCDSEVGVYNGEIIVSCLLNGSPVVSRTTGTFEAIFMENDEMIVTSDSNRIEDENNVLSLLESQLKTLAEPLNGASIICDLSIPSENKIVQVKVRSHLDGLTGEFEKVNVSTYDSNANTPSDTPMTNHLSADKLVMNLVTPLNDDDDSASFHDTIIARHRTSTQIDIFRCESKMQISKMGSKTLGGVNCQLITDFIVEDVSSGCGHICGDGEVKACFSADQKTNEYCQYSTYFLFPETCSSTCSGEWVDVSPASDATCVFSSGSCGDGLKSGTKKCVSLTDSNVDLTNSDCPELTTTTSTYLTEACSLSCDIGVLGFKELSASIIEGVSYDAKISRSDGIFSAISGTVTMTKGSEKCTINGGNSPVSVDFADGNDDDVTVTVLCNNDSEFTFTEVELTLSGSSPSLIEDSKKLFTLESIENDCIDGACTDYSSLTETRLYLKDTSTWKEAECLFWNPSSGNEEYGLRCRGDLDFLFSQSMITNIENAISGDDTYVELVAFDGKLVDSSENGIVRLKGKRFSIESVKYFSIQLSSDDMPNMPTWEFSVKGDDVTSGTSNVDINSGSSTVSVPKISYESRFFQDSIYYFCSSSSLEGHILEYSCHTSQFDTPILQVGTSQCGTSGSGYHECKSQTTVVDNFFCGGIETDVTFVCGGLWVKGICSPNIADTCGVGVGSYDSILCKKDSATIDDSNCSVGTKPTLSCDISCSGTWSYGTCSRDVSASTDECGTDVGTQDAVCSSGDDNDCDSASRPDIRSCDISCDGAWTKQAHSPSERCVLTFDSTAEEDAFDCSSNTKDGSMTDIYECKKDGAVVDEIWCSTNVKPSTSTTCTVDSSVCDGTWANIIYESDCNTLQNDKNCGQADSGIKNVQSGDCLDASNATIEKYFCDKTDSTFTSPQKCELACTGTWSTDLSHTSCEKNPLITSCGTDSGIIPAKCIITDSVVSDGLCEIDSKPTAVSCDIPCTGTWSFGDWSLCEACGIDSTKTRSATCDNNDEYYCDESLKIISEVCNVSCPEWKLDTDWDISACSDLLCLTYPYDQKRIKRVNCVLTDDVKLSKDCDGYNIINTLEDISETCPDLVNCEASFSIGDWGECSEYCQYVDDANKTIIGSQTRSIGDCFEFVDPNDSSKKSIVKTGGELTACGSPPPPSQPCNTQLCDFSWRSGFYEKTCSNNCGKGTVSRTVECVGRKLDASFFVTEDYLCGEDKPITKKDCEVYNLIDNDCSAVFSIDWSGCTETCGGGTQYLMFDSPPCTVNTLTPDVAECKRIFLLLNPDISTARTCNNDACANQEVMYNWVLEQSDVCLPKEDSENECGFGEIISPYKCQKSIIEDGVIVNSGLPAEDSDCTASKPADVVTGCSFTDPCYSYVWESGEFGDCNLVCGGKKTKEIKCKGVHITDSTKIKYVGDSFCTDASVPDNLTEDCEACVYQWTHDAFATDDASCITDNCSDGIRYRSVKCDRVDGSTLIPQTEDVCVAAGIGTKPNVSESCNPNCSYFIWKLSNWGSCTPTEGTCGDGTRTRPAAICTEYNNDGEVGATTDDKCTATVSKPVNSSECVLACPEEPKYKYEWEASTFWGSCSKTCRETEDETHGTKQRALICYRYDVDDAGSASNKTKMETTEECANKAENSLSSEEICFTPLCPEYEWIELENWNTCSADCFITGEDLPYQVQSVLCVDKNTKCTSADCAVTDSKCNLSTKPDHVRDCTTLPECYIPTQWNHNTAALENECVTTVPAGKVQCGYEQKAVTKECVLASDETTVVDDMKCGELGHIDDYVSCPRYCDMTYYWASGEFGGCSSKDCNLGIQYRTRQCIKEVSNRRLRYLATSNVEESECLEQGIVPPATTRTCQGITSSCKNFEWKYTFDKCDAECGGGIQLVKTATCQETISDSTVSDSNCTGTKLAYKTCNNYKCPTFEWRADDFGDCNELCGANATKDRFVGCVYNQRILAPDEYCNAALKPSLTTACVEGTDSYDDSPFKTVCESDFFYWLPGQWGSCSKPNCGEGIATRTMTCMKKPFGSNVAVKTVNDDCHGIDSPISAMKCNVTPCETYKWVVTEKGTCSVECGGGELFNTIACVNSKNSVVPDSNCSSITDKPTTTEPCNQVACNWCDQTSCNNESSASNSCNRITEKCECDSSLWYGDYCQNSRYCDGIQMKDNTCCTTTVDKSGLCCPDDGSILDKYGNCCSSGSLNGCGECLEVGKNDNAILIPGSTECCTSGNVDSNLYCCMSPYEIDSCNICGGVNECMSKAKLKETKPLLVDTCADYYAAMTNENSLQYIQERDSYAKIMGIPAENVNLADIFCEAITSGSGRRLADTTTYFDVSVSAIVTGLDDGKTLSERSDEIAANISKNAPNVESLVTVGGICGDGVCAIDEQCLPGSDNCCSSDCVVIQICDAPDFSNEQCGGVSRGACSNGLCVCNEGYDGETCGTCAQGYVMNPVSNICTKLVIGFFVQETCNDGILNNGETGIDCGGVNCPSCPSDGDDDDWDLFIYIGGGLMMAVLISLIIFIFVLPSSKPIPKQNKKNTHYDNYHQQQHQRQQHQQQRDLNNGYDDEDGNIYEAIVIEEESDHKASPTVLNPGHSHDHQADLTGINPMTTTLAGRMSMRMDKNQQQQQRELFEDKDSKQERSRLVIKSRNHSHIVHDIDEEDKESHIEFEFERNESPDQSNLQQQQPEHFEHDENESKADDYRDFGAVQRLLKEQEQKKKYNPINPREQQQQQYQHQEQVVLEPDADNSTVGTSIIGESVDDDNIEYFTRFNGSGRPISPSKRFLPISPSSRFSVRSNTGSTLSMNSNNGNDLNMTRNTLSRRRNPNLPSSISTMDGSEEVGNNDHSDSVNDRNTNTNGLTIIDDNNKINNDSTSNDNNDMNIDDILPHFDDNKATNHERINQERTLMNVSTVHDIASDDDDIGDSDDNDNDINNEPENEDRKSEIIIDGEDDSFSALVYKNYNVIGEDPNKGGIEARRQDKNPEEMYYESKISAMDDDDSI